MRCENCNQNPAVIEMNVQINNKKQKLHLCESCYAKVKQQMKFPSGFSHGFSGSSPFDDFFKGFMQPSMGAAHQGMPNQGQQGVYTQQGG
ncbi:MAG TPA: ATP-dependent Clp protease ATP-binding subunit, partial [Bacillales bacterium]